ncbi:hypothetical protein DBR32_13920 [Taibaiella sp. KBW10]|nr:hypothetical protein DBR32_13920 [Taibaiella sp. KBW10]
MQKVPSKNQGYNKTMAKNQSVGRKPNSLRSDNGLRLIDRANDFLNAGFIRPILSDLFCKDENRHFWFSYVYGNKRTNKSVAHIWIS